MTIPELGTVAAVRRPFVVLTSNATRELSEAVKRRCLYLHLDYPDAEREREIVARQVPDLEARRRRQLVATVGRLRDAGAEEGAVDRRVRRLGAHPGRAGDPRPRRARRSPTRSASCSSTPPTSDRAVRELRLRAVTMTACSTATSRSSRRCAAPGCRCRWPRASTRSPRCARCRWDDRETVRAALRRHAGQAADPAAHLRRALRPLLPAAGRRGAAADRDDDRSSTTCRDNARGAGGRSASELARGAGRRRPASPGSRLAVEMVARFGAMPGRGPGLSSWSAYTALQRVSPAELTDRLVGRRAARSEGRTEEQAARAGRARGSASFARLVEDDARRRIAEEKGPDHVARRRGAARPSTGSTSPPPAAPTSRRCAARSSRWPGGWPPG